MYIARVDQKESLLSDLSGIQNGNLLSKSCDYFTWKTSTYVITCISFFSWQQKTRGGKKPVRCLSTQSKYIDL